MVFKPKEEQLTEFDDPNAFEKQDCLSCRVLGMSFTPCPTRRLSPTYSTHLVEWHTHSYQARLLSSR
jgi:hypothetical protein